VRGNQQTLLLDLIRAATDLGVPYPLVGDRRGQCSDLAAKGWVLIKKVDGQEVAELTAQGLQRATPRK
jgi:hypothetical protein